YPEPGIRPWSEPRGTLRETANPHGDPGRFTEHGRHTGWTRDRRLREQTSWTRDPASAQEAIPVARRGGTGPVGVRGAALPADPHAFVRCASAAGCTARKSVGGRAARVGRAGR